MQFLQYISVLFYFFDDIKYLFSCRDFRHEKTKKKRGTYRGGVIDLDSHSVKFNYSDEEWLESILVNLFFLVKKLFSCLLLEHHAKTGVVIKILLNYGSFKQNCLFGQQYFNSFKCLDSGVGSSALTSLIVIWTWVVFYEEFVLIEVH